MSQPVQPEQSLRLQANVTQKGPDDETARLRKRNPNDFEFGDVLGEGAFSTVLYAKETGTTAEFAVKVLDKRHIIKEKKVKYVQSEKDILSELDHEFIIRLYYTFQDSQSLYFVLEYAPNGDLQTQLRKHSKFSLSASRFYAAEICVAVAHLHSKGIIHRDLKPENVLLSGTWHIKLTDFGTAKSIRDASTYEDNPAKRRNSFVGTAEFCSPEILDDKAATDSSDIWAIGCTLYHFLVGTPPFHGNHEYQTFQNILKLRFSIPESTDSQAQLLISQILQIKAEERLKMTQIMAHPFFQSIDWGNLPQAVPPAF